MGKPGSQNGISNNPNGIDKIEFSKEDWEKIDKMCECWCIGKEIADIMGVSYSTLERRIKETHGVSSEDYIAQKGSGGKRSLRRSQFNKAVHEGSAVMQIWLGKQKLGQKDTTEVVLDKPIQLNYNLDEKPKVDGDDKADG